MVIREHTPALVAKPTRSAVSTSDTVEHPRRFNVDEVAEVLGMTPARVRAFWRAGLLPGFRPGRLYRFTVEDVLAYLSPHLHAEHTVAGKHDTAQAGDVVARCREWCEANGFAMMRANEIAEELQARGFRRQRTMHGAVYHGFRLRDPGEA